MKMAKKCIYCKKEITEDRAIDVCDTCGVGVWGPKMFNTIVRKMEDAREKNDLVSTNTVGIQTLEKLGYKGF